MKVKNNFFIHKMASLKERWNDPIWGIIAYIFFHIFCKTITKKNYCEPVFIPHDLLYFYWRNSKHWFKINLSVKRSFISYFTHPHEYYYREHCKTSPEIQYPPEVFWQSYSSASNIAASTELSQTQLLPKTLFLGVHAQFWQEKTKCDLLSLSTWINRTELNTSSTVVINSSSGFDRS